MKSKFLFSILLTVYAGAACAERQINTIDQTQFDAITPDKLSPTALEYTESVQLFSDLLSQSPNKAQLLLLFPGYDQSPGMLRNAKGGVVAYLAQTKTLLNIAPGKIDLKRMIDINNLASIDPQIQIQKIAPEQQIQNVVGVRPVTNWDWFNPTDPLILRPKQETNLSYLKAHQFCADPARSICVESGYALAGLVHDFVYTYNLGASEKKDMGIGMQSEIRYYLNEAEYGPAIPLNQLTHIDSPVTGVVEQNIYYFNQVFVYAKIILVLQQDLSDPGKTIMSSIAVMALREHTWNTTETANFLHGTSFLNFHQTSLGAGVPTFTQVMANKISEILER